MDTIAAVLFSIAIVSFVGIGAYSIAASSVLIYDFVAFEPSQRIGWKRVPRAIVMFGIISMGVFAACVVIGGVFAVLDR
jgi:hypothetical protein